MKALIIIAVLISLAPAYTPATFAPLSIPPASIQFGKMYSSGWRVPKPSGTGEWMAASAGMTLGACFLAAVTIIPTRPPEQQRTWCTIIGTVGAAAWLTYFLSHLSK